MNLIQHIPRVSILMPAYNCEAYVAEAIESILNQTFSDWELLIADDYSTDKTRDIIDGYTDIRIRKLHNLNHLGVVDTRNKLISHSRGEYIVWQDADDVSMPQRLETLVSVLDKDPTIAICGSNTMRIYPFSGVISTTNYPLSYEEIRASINETNIPFTGPSTALRRSILSSSLQFRKFFDIGGEDPDFVLRIAEKYRIINVPDVLYHYRYTRNSMSRRFDKNIFYKLYVIDIVFFLAKQRERTEGFDGLMEGGDYVALSHFLNDLKINFERDESVIYRKSCQSKISNQDYFYALKEAVLAVKLRPDVFKNYMLFVKTIGSFVKTISRIILKTLASPNRRQND